MEALIEFRDEVGGWSQLGAECFFTPPAPLVVGDRQTVSFECEMVGVVPADRAVRAVILADLFGTDDVFRQKIAINP